MKVVNPDLTTHNTTLIPRFYPSGSIVFELYNETTRQKNTVANTYSIVDGELTLTYDFTFTDKEKYQIKVTEGDNVVYRGKLIATTQQPQDYKLTNGLYIYE